jgi:hypothetical protein
MKVRGTIQRWTAIFVVALATIIQVGCQKDKLSEIGNLKVGKIEKLGANSGIQFSKNPISVMYVEVNSNDIREVGKYKLADGHQLFDLAIIFAANINYNTSTSKAYLHFNTQVTNVLTNRNTYIKPLQDRGIKVTLSILGNHQGAGFANFPNQAAAQAFAQEVANAVNTYGLDG